MSLKKIKTAPTSELRYCCQVRTRIGTGDLADYDL